MQKTCYTGDIAIRTVDDQDTGIRVPKRTGNATNAVMNRGRAIQRHDHVIYALGDRLRLRFQQQSGGKQANPASGGTKHLRQATPLLIQLRLTARKDKPPDTELLERT